MPLLYLCRGVLVDVAFKGVSVEADFEDIEASYGKEVRHLRVAPRLV